MFVRTKVLAWIIFTVCANPITLAETVQLLVSMVLILEDAIVTLVGLVHLVPSNVLLAQMELHVLEIVLTRIANAHLDYGELNAIKCALLAPDKVQWEVLATLEQANVCANRIGQDSSALKTLELNIFLH